MSSGGDSIKKLKKRLYKKGVSFKRRNERPRFDNKRGGVGFEGNPAREEWSTSQTNKKGSLNFFKSAKWFLVLGGIFFSVVFLFTAYFWNNGSNFVSNRNIEISFEGPSAVRGGVLANWQIFITNKNNAPLQVADLILDYPPETEILRGKSGAVRERYFLGEIKPGETVSKDIEVILFGAEGSRQDVVATVEYRISGSNAIFAKTITKKINLLESPVEVKVEIPEEINAKEEFSFEIKYISNADTFLEDLYLKIEYPTGFQFIESTVDRYRNEKNLWKIGTLEPAKERIIKIKGIIDGNDLDEKVFRAEVGILNEDGSFRVYGEKIDTVVLKKSFLDLAIFINGKDQDTNIALAGDILRVNLAWKNNLPVKIENGSIEVKLRGIALDEQSISVTKGFYRAADKTLVWNAGSLPEFRFVEPGGEGQVRFNFSVLQTIPQERLSDKNFTISINGKILGEKTIGGLSDVDITSKSAKEIKILSDLQFAPQALYYTGLFQNSGPLPPQVGKETTYTVVWALSNSFNDVTETTVSAFLPSYIRFLGVTNPIDAPLSYNVNNGEIIWNVGSIAAGTGALNAVQEISFQVGLIPSLSQVYSAPILVSDTVVEGVDTFTGVNIREVKGTLTTRLDSDPRFVRGQDKVVE